MGKNWVDDIQVAAPCRASWKNMEGNDTARFCQTCAKNVYNISLMSRAEAEELIRAKEGKLCVRFYRRADGTVMNDNCPVGLRVLRRPFKWLAAGAAALLASGVAVFAGPQANRPACAVPDAQPSGLRQSKIVQMVLAWTEPEPQVVAGGISVAPPPTPTPTATPTPPPLMGEIAMPSHITMRHPK